MKQTNKKKIFGLVSKLGSFINKTQPSAPKQIEEEQKEIEPEIPQKKKRRKKI